MLENRSYIRTRIRRTVYLVETGKWSRQARKRQEIYRITRLKNKIHRYVFLQEERLAPSTPWTIPRNLYSVQTNSHSYDTEQSRLRNPSFDSWNLNPWLDAEFLIAIEIIPFVPQIRMNAILRWLRYFTSVSWKSSGNNITSCVSYMIERKTGWENENGAAICFL